MLPYANGRGNHQATVFKCLAGQEAKAEVWEKKAQKSQNKKQKQLYVDEEEADRPTSKFTVIELDTDTHWFKSPKEPSSDLSLVGVEKLKNFQNK